MSDEIFGKEAPKFWERDLKVVPLEPGEKRPAKELVGWEGNLAALPNEKKREAWLERYAENGIGMLLGSEVSHGLVLVALDVDDDRLEAPILRLLQSRPAEQPPIISGKKGKKGATFFVLVAKEHF